MEHTIRDCPQRDKRQSREQKPTSSSEIANVDQEQEEDDFLTTVYYPIQPYGEIFNIDFMTSLDSGSPISFIKKRFVNSVALKVIDSSGFDYAGINNSKMNIHGILDVTANLGKGPKNIMKSSVVLGRDALKKFGLRLIESPEIKETTQEILNIEVEACIADKVDCFNIIFEYPKRQSR